MKRNYYKLSILFSLSFVLGISFAWAQPAVTNDNLALTAESGLTLTIEGSFVNQNGGSINNAGDINISGDWTNNVSNNVFTTETGTVKMNGTSAQTIGGTYSTSFFNLTLNNTAVSSPAFILEADQWVKNELIMTAGNTNMSNKTLTLGLRASNPGLLSYTSGWFYGGIIKRWFDTNGVGDGGVEGLFPLGSATDSRPFYISAPLVPPSTGGTISVSHNHFAGTSGVLFVDSNVIIDFQFNPYWTVDTADGLSGGTYNLRADATGLPGITDISVLRLTQSDTALGIYGTNGGTTANPQVNRAGLTIRHIRNDFFISYPSSPLPVQLLNFDVTSTENIVVSNWSTANELNSDYFMLERSADEDNYITVNTVKAAGMSNSNLDYSSTDNDPLPGLSYYRLKQVDMNGDFKYTSPRAVYFGNKVDQFEMVSVQSLKDKINVTIYSGTAGEYELNFYDYSGRLIFQNSGTLISGNNEMEIPVKSFYNGIYLISVSNSEHMISKKVSLVSME